MGKFYEGGGNIRFFMRCFGNDKSKEIRIVVNFLTINLVKTDKFMKNLWGRPTCILTNYIGKS
jgi:hypothetical protein